MPTGLRAITIKNVDILGAAGTPRRLAAANRKYGQQLQKELAKYPPQEPTDYVRTGSLARGWLAPGSLKADSTQVIVVNRVKYSVFVQGPTPGGGRPGTRQAKVMKRKGWESISVVARRAKKAYPQVINKEIKGRL